jgi:phage terminase large subunit-like protein
MAKELAHGGDPILTWMLSHVSVELDAAGNVKLSKKKSRERIDGLVAIVMALGRALVRLQNQPPKFDLLFVGGR